jgi:hypothetical protein
MPRRPVLRYLVVSNGYRVFFPEVRWVEYNPTTHPHLPVRLRMNGAVLPLPLTSLSEVLNKEQRQIS